MRYRSIYCQEQEFLNSCSVFVNVCVFLSDAKTSVKSLMYISYLLDPHSRAVNRKKQTCLLAGRPFTICAVPFQGGGPILLRPQGAFA